MTYQLMRCVVDVVASALRKMEAKRVYGCAKEI